MNNDSVVLIDQNDREIGVMDKILAHQRGLLHRAFSVFIFRLSKTGGLIELLLQQRHFAKYHSGGLWTNACCGHPRPQEEIASAARRRLHEEVQLCVPLRFLDKFYYRAECSNGLIEHEIDHVFVGEIVDQPVVINPIEIETVRWVNLASLQEEIAKKPNHFTPWFKPALAILIQDTEFVSHH